MFTTSTSLHSSTQLPIIVEMINTTRIVANEGGQQPSEMVYLANWKTPRAQMPPSTRFSPKCPVKLAGIAHILTGSAPQTENDVSYRKQRTEYFLTGSRTAIKNTEFSSRAAQLLSGVSAGSFGASRPQRQAATAPSHAGQRRTATEGHPKLVWYNPILGNSEAAWNLRRRLNVAS
jgi:hypothetical protein